MHNRVGLTILTFSLLLCDITLVHIYLANIASLDLNLHHTDVHMSICKHQIGSHGILDWPHACMSTALLPVTTSI